MSIIRIALTGGPCGGKTTCQIKAEKEFGSQILSTPEVASVLLGHLFPSPGNEPDAIERWSMSFQQSVLPTQLGMEDQFIEMARRNATRLILTDRGGMDGASYLGKGRDYFLKRFNLTKEEIFDRYDVVIHFETLAASQPDLYEQLKGTNPARYETAEQAVARDLSLQEVWNDHPHWVIIPSTDSMMVKTQKLISIIGSFLNVEIERKFLIDSLPPNLGKGKLIKQGYFASQSEIRLRQDGEEFLITFKGPGSIKRSECERAIPQWVFEENWIHTEGRRVEKVRYKKPYQSHTLEIDQFSTHPEGPFLMECEFGSEEEADNFIFPPWAKGIREVTNDPSYKNRSIAINGFPA